VDHHVGFDTADDGVGRFWVGDVAFVVGYAGASQAWLCNVQHRDVGLPHLEQQLDDAVAEHPRAAHNEHLAQRRLQLLLRRHCGKRFSSDRRLSLEKFLVGPFRGDS